MSERQWTKDEVRRAASVLWPHIPTDDLSVATEKVALRALDAGMRLPPDPVREKLARCIGNGWHAWASADAILREFNVHPKDRR